MNTHESKGTIERANRTLRQFFDRIRAYDKRSTIDMILAEATYGKNISIGSKTASSYELLFSKKPKISKEIDCQTGEIMTIDDENRHKTLRRLQNMLRSNVRTPQKFSIGQNVYFWRDNCGRNGPEIITELNEHYAIIVHNGKRITSSYNRIRKSPTMYCDDESEDV